MFLPRGTLPGAVKANELLSAASQWMGDNCDAEDEQSTAFQDVLICGMGWTEARIDTEIDPEGAYTEKRIDPLEMLSDCRARAKNVSDARRVWRVHKMSYRDAKDMFQGDGLPLDSSDLDAPWAEGAEIGEAVPVEERRKKRSESTGPDNKREVRIVQCQWYDKETYYRVADPMSGQIVDMGAKEVETLRSRLEEAGQDPTILQAVPMTRRVYKQAWLGGKILKQGPAPFPKGFTFACITGEADRNNGTFYGLSLIHI